jgi:ribonuclease HI
MDPGKKKIHPRFDRGLRGNPGPSGLGGVITTLDGRICRKLVWNIRENTYNQAEALAILK